MTGSIVLRHARIVDCTGRAPIEDGAVVVEGGVIREVADSARVTRPPGALLLNCGGHTLIPGLTDAHVHVVSVEANSREMHRVLPPSLIVLKASVALRDMLQRGFTTVRDCGGADWGLREAVAQGVIPGPRLLVSGRYISQTGGHGDLRLRAETGAPVTPYASMVGVVADGVDEVRRAVREELRRGADQIKVMASGGCASPTDELETTQYSSGELRAAVDEARAAGSYVCAHAYSAAGVRHAVEAGVRSVEHGNLIDEGAARAIKAADAFLVPTMVASVATAEEGPRFGLPADFLRKIRVVRDRARDALALAHSVGVRIASGSDLLIPMSEYQGMELALKADVLSPEGALISATRTNAELFRLEEQIGTVEVGKLADLLLVRGDPLSDPRLFQSPDENLLLIMQAGHLVKSRLP